MSLADVWEHHRVVEYIQQHGYSRITLQFPDDLLQHATSVAQELQQLLRGSPAAKVFVLADTSYNPLSIDEVAAAHVKADCVVHYGYASLHPVSRTPALCILPKQQLDVQATSTWLLQQLEQLHQQVQAASSTGSTAASAAQEQVQQQGPVAVICSDQGYIHLLPQLQQAVLQAYSGPLQLVFAQSAPTELWPQQHQPAGHAGAAAGAPSPAAADSSGSGACSNDQNGAAHPACCAQQPQVQQQPPAAATPAPVPIGGLLWELPGTSNHTTDSSSSSSSSNADTSNSRPVYMVWLGPPEGPALTHLQLSFAGRPWLLLDPAAANASQGLSTGLERLMKRRYYLVERARGASLVGLLVGTLGAAGYKAALQQLRRLAQQAGKKTYTLLMGRPNPAKLANFPEIEVFVMLADPQGLILDCKEYLQPIVTPHEAFLAFTGRDFDAAHYRMDFGDLLDLEQQQQQEQQEGQDNSTDGGLLQEQQQQAGGHGRAHRASLGGNTSEVAADGSSDSGDEGGQGGAAAAEQLCHAAGALVIAGGSSSQAVTGKKAGQQLQVQSAAQYLTQRRTYKGLETPATGAAIVPAAVAVEGRSGRAAGYADEPQQ